MKKLKIIVGNFCSSLTCVSGQPAPVYMLADPYSLLFYN